MKQIINIVLVLCMFIPLTAFQQEKPRKEAKGKPKMATAEISFKKDVFPIFKKYCLPCHTEDQMNPSELYMESYADLMKGGKHGLSITAGKADSSLIVKKINATPPFGDAMPFKRKTPFPGDTLMIIKRWITQGAKNN